MNTYRMLLSLMVFVAACTGWGVYVIATTERPSSTWARSLPSWLEIRDYDAQTWISTDLESDRTVFPVLASYIFGDNAREQRVAMTAPVTDRRMSFVLPKEVTIDNAPTPNGQPIEFTSVPPRRVATPNSRGSRHRRESKAKRQSYSMSWTAPG